MIQVIVSKNNLSDKLYEKLVKFTDYLITKLLKKYSLNNERIKLKIRLNKEKSMPYSKGWGYDCGYIVCKSENNYAIKINSNMTERDILETLCHEIIHFKQYVKGEMKFFERCGEQYGMWKGKIICKTSKIDEAENHKHIISLAPWEEEAYRKDSKLVTQFEEEKGKL
jgi:hypothetical protein